MNQRTIILVIILFAVIIAGMFTFAFLKKSEMSSPQPSVSENLSNREDKYTSITRIDGKHYFQNGVHTIVGEVLMPTPCDLLETDATVAESFPEQVFLDFSVVNNAEFCAQQVTPQRFKVTATASGEASFSAEFMGRDVELNLIPAEPGESPEEFEIFIKG